MKFKNLGLKQLQALAKTLAIKYNEKPAVIGLIGSLGAGKTTFVKAFGTALGIRKIKSPSFVVVHQYHTPKRTVYHLDFYRLRRAKQLSPLGLGEILDGPSLVLAEWIDKFPKLIKKCNLLITIKINQDQSRDVEIRTIK
jgi:tRNA threonylcarbamoyladenosine biosynthesis protein TsaE